MSKTPLRAIRIDNELWAAAQAKAESENDNLSSIIRDALRQYIQEGEPRDGQ